MDGSTATAAQRENNSDERQMKASLVFQLQLVNPHKDLKVTTPAFLQSLQERVVDVVLKGQIAKKHFSEETRFLILLSHDFLKAKILSRPLLLLGRKSVYWVIDLPLLECNSNGLHKEKVVSRNDRDKSIMLF